MEMQDVWIGFISILGIGSVTFLGVVWLMVKAETQRNDHNHPA